MCIRDSRQGGRASESVERAAHTGGPEAEYVRVDHRGAHVPVAEQLLDGADVVAGLEQMRRKGVAESVAGGVLGYAGALHGVFDGALDGRRVDVVAALLIGATVGPATLLREDPLPAPLGRGGGVLALEGCGELDPSPAVGEVSLVDRPGVTDLVAERRLEGARERGAAVLAALAAAHGEFAARPRAGAPRPDPSRQVGPPARPRRQLGTGRAPRSPPAQVPRRPGRVALAVGLPAAASLDRPSLR